MYSAALSISVVIDPHLNKGRANKTRQRKKYINWVRVPAYMSIWCVKEWRHAASAVGKAQRLQSCGYAEGHVKRGEVL